MKYLYKTLFLLSILLITACEESDYLVTISTEYGNMKLVLFDETPLHKAKFIEFAKDGKYDSTTFHRVIREFMVQGGDVNRLPGVTDKDNTLIDAEFRPNLVHTKGALAGARTNNPEKRSGTQFYIVHGRKFSREELVKLTEDSYYNQCVQKLNQLFQEGKNKDVLNDLIALQQVNDDAGVREKVLESVGIVEAEYGKIVKKSYTDEQLSKYESIGGSPHLDWEYTVFGQVVEGLEIVDKIAEQSTGPGDVPLEDIYMMVTVEEISKKKIAKLYGIEYPEEK